ncbi:MAG: hypothetical protein GY711_35360 [bacterium]|nr:hypothetical protein [bacterium]
MTDHGSDTATLFYSLRWKRHSDSDERAASERAAFEALLGRTLVRGPFSSASESGSESVSDEVDSKRARALLEQFVIERMGPEFSLVPATHNTPDAPTYCIDELGNCWECHNHSLMRGNEIVGIQLKGEPMMLAIAVCRRSSGCDGGSEECPVPYHFK